MSAVLLLVELFDDVVFLCLTAPLPPVLGVIALLGERPIEPTEAALGAGGFFSREKKAVEINKHHFAGVMYVLVKINVK